MPSAYSIRAACKPESPAPSMMTSAACRLAAAGGDLGAQAESIAAPPSSARRLRVSSILHFPLDDGSK